MNEALLSARELSVGYHGRPLLREICLQVRRGEILTLIGPNGAGKSTILKSLIGQLRLLGGQVSLLGRDMVQLSEREIARSLSVMMTGRAQLERMTCWEAAAIHTPGGWGSSVPGTGRRYGPPWSVSTLWICGTHSLTRSAMVSGRGCCWPEPSVRSRKSWSWMSPPPSWTCAESWSCWPF